MNIDPTGLDDYVFFDPENFSTQAETEYNNLVGERGGDESQVHMIIPGVDKEGNKVVFEDQWTVYV